MESNTNTAIFAVLTLAIGFVAGFAVRGPQMPLIDTHIMSGGVIMKDADMSMHVAMEDMMSGLEGKSGDEFDKAFLSSMIVHHDGAVKMAKATEANAKHQELKDLAGRIIHSQTSEIEQMKNWQRDWYKQ